MSRGPQGGSNVHCFRSSPPTMPRDVTEGGREEGSGYFCPPAEKSIEDWVGSSFQSRCARLDGRAMGACTSQGGCSTPPLEPTPWIERFIGWRKRAFQRGTGPAELVLSGAGEAPTPSSWCRTEVAGPSTRPCSLKGIHCLSWARTSAVRLRRARLTRRMVP